MSLPIDYPNRQLIPIWRSFAETNTANELSSAGTRQHASLDVSRLIEDWQDKKNIVLASELVNAGVISGNKNIHEIIEAKKFISNNISPGFSLNSFLGSNAIEKNKTYYAGTLADKFNLLLEDVTVDTIDAIWHRQSMERRHERLKELKHATVEQLRNPINWVDRALLYVVEGHFEKAERCMRIALSIDPDNRFILRAATTLFVHLGDTTEAIYYLRKSARTKFDPWLISAHIAASNSLGRFSPFLKDGRNILEANKIAPIHLTELASSIATEEYKAGALKKSRNYFGLSLRRPNGNSLAQMEWISLQDNRFPFNPEHYNKLSAESFEANAFNALEQGRLEEGMLYAIKWYWEAPYNRLSVSLCTFLLISIFEKYTDAIEFCLSGLKIHNDDPILVNNMIYCYVMLNRQGEIEALIKKFVGVDPSILTPINRMAYYATSGLLMFREGFVQEGRRLYESALELARKEKDESKENLALINLARELVLINAFDKNRYILQVANIQRTTKFVYVKIVSNAFMKKYGNQFAISS